MAEDKKKKDRGRARLLHACKDHGIVVLAETGDNRVELLNGDFVEEGKPVHPDDGLYVLHQEDDDGYTIEIIREPGQSTGKGPAKANSHSFRKGYDAIFGKTKAEKELLN